MSESNEQLYDQFADLNKLDAQKKSILAMFLEVKQGLKDLQEAGIKLDQAKGMKGLNDGLKAQKKANDELSVSVAEYNRILTNNARLEAKIAAMQSDEARKLADLTVKRRQANKELEQEARIINTVTGSLENLRARKAALINQRDKIALVDDKSIQQVEDLNKRIDNLDTIIKRNSSTVEKFKQNVGNYAGSLADGFELVRREINRLQRDQKDLSVRGDTRGAEAAGRQIKELNDIIQVSFDRSKNFDQVVKSLQKSFSTMAASGSQSNEFLEQFKLVVADAKDQAEDLKAEIKALSSDTRSLDLLTGGISTLASGFEVAAGASALFGGENENVEKSLQKLVAIQSVANGVREIAKQLTERGTLANKLYAYSQQQVAIMTNISSTATQKFGALLKLTAFGIIATAAGFIISQFAKLGEKSKELINIQESIDAVAKETAESFAAEKVALDLLIEEYQRGNTTQKRRLEIFNELQDKYPKYFGDLNKEKVTVDEITEAYTKLSRALLLRARVAAATAELSKNEAKAIQLAIQLGVEDLSKLEEVAISFYKNAPGGLVNDLFKREIAGFFSARKTLKGIVEASQKELDSLGGDPTKETPRVKASKKEVKEIEKNERDLLAKIFSLRESASDLFTEEMDRKMSDNQRDFDTLQKIAEKARDEQLAANQKGFNAGITSQENYTKRRDRIEKDYQATVLTGQVDFLEKQLALLKAYGADVTALEAAIAEARKKILELKSPSSSGTGEGSTNNDLKDLEEFLEKAKGIYEKFAEFTSGITRAIADREKNRLQEQIDQIEKNKQREIDLINASADTAEEKAARIKLVEAKTQAEREALQRRQREADYRAAAYEKALIITQIVLTNALNVVKVIPKGPAAVLGAIAVGALQLAVAIARPIPKYYRGRTASDPYEGPALVGDRGREIGISREGVITMYDKPTLTHLYKGDTILPNHVTEQMMRATEREKAAVMAAGLHTATSSATAAEFSIGEKAMIKELRDLNQKSRIIIQNAPGVESSAWYQKNIKQ